MKKRDVFNLIVAGISAANPAVGAAVAGVGAGVGRLIKHDDDPTNDLDETADALTDIAMAVLLGVESVKQADYVNDPVLRQVAANIKATLHLAQLVIVKPKAA